MPTGKNSYNWEYFKTWIWFYIFRGFRNLPEGAITYMETKHLPIMKYQNEINLLTKIISYNKNKLNKLTTKI